MIYISHIFFRGIQQFTFYFLVYHLLVESLTQDVALGRSHILTTAGCFLANRSSCIAYSDVDDSRKLGNVRIE